MNRAWFLFLVLPGIIGLLTACGDGGSETPTEAGTVVRLTFHLQTASAEIQRARLLLDGSEVATAEVPGGASQVTLEAIRSGVARGPHSVRIVIVQQVSSPNEYLAGGAVETMGVVQDLAAVRGVLATGEGLDFRIGL